MEKRFFDFLKVIDELGTPSKPFTEKQGLFGYRNANGDIVEVAVRPARPVPIVSDFSNGGIS